MSDNRVALISYHTCPMAALGSGKTGGMNVYVRELARRLGSGGTAVDIFTRYHTGHEEEVADLGADVRLVHLPGGPLAAPVDTLYTYLPLFLEALHRFAEQEGRPYRVVHSHYWLSGWVGRRAAANWVVPHVVTFHTLAEIKARARAGESEPPLRSNVEKDLIDSAQLVIASSSHEKDAIVRLYHGEGHRIEVVPCGVDLSLFRPLDVHDARQRLGLNGEKVILYVGRVEPIKGLELLLRSAAIMESQEPFKLMLIGGDNTKDGEVDRLMRLAEDLGIENVTEFVGTVDQKQLPLYYNAADVCVVPSYYESFGLVALEALACGTPVVASRVGGLPTVVQHGRNGYLVSWRCPEPFADCLEVILSSKGLRRSMGQAARQWAEGMGWEMVAEETQRLYDSL